MAMTLQSSGVPREMIGQVMGHKEKPDAKELKDVKGEITFDNVSFKYKDGSDCDIARIVTLRQEKHSAYSENNCQKTPDGFLFTEE